jgi:hypothetical protein
VVYVDAAGLEPPEENGVSNLVLKATTPHLSIGLLSDFTSNNSKIFAVDKTGDAGSF